MFRCTIPGDPRGKGSVRVSRWGAHKDEKTEVYMGVAIMVCRAAMAGRPAIEVPVVVTIRALLRRPEALIPKTGPRVRSAQPPAGSFPAPVKPDYDNIAKIVGDSLVQAGVLRDDTLITTGHLYKRYVPVGESPRVEVEIEAEPDAWARSSGA